MKHQSSTSLSRFCVQFFFNSELIFVDFPLAECKFSALRSVKDSFKDSLRDAPEADLFFSSGAKFEVFELSSSEA